jgi:hypothetical protein
LLYDRIVVRDLLQDGCHCGQFSQPILFSHLFHPFQLIIEGDLLVMMKILQSATELQDALTGSEKGIVGAPSQIPR